MSLQEAYERMSRLHELHRFTTTAGKGGGSEVISEKDVDRALELFVFESMNVTGVDENGNLCSTQDDETNGDKGTSTLTICW